MIRTPRWRAPGIVMIGCMILGPTSAESSEIQGPGRGSALPSARLGDLGEGLGRRATVAEGGQRLGDLESLGRRLAGLDPSQVLLDRMTTQPATAAALMPDLLPRPVSPEGMPAVGGFDRTLMARVPAIDSEDASRPTTPPELPRFPIPEPASLMLITAGLVGLWVRGHLRRKLGR